MSLIALNFVSIMNIHESVGSSASFCFPRTKTWPSSSMAFPTPMEGLGDSRPPITGEIVKDSGTDQIVWRSSSDGSDVGDLQACSTTSSAELRYSTIDRFVSRRRGSNNNSVVRVLSSYDLGALPHKGFGPALTHATEPNCEQSVASHIEDHRVDVGEGNNLVMVVPLFMDGQLEQEHASFKHDPSNLPTRPYSDHTYANANIQLVVAITTLAIAFGVITNMPPPLFNEDGDKLLSLWDLASGNLPANFYFLLLVGGIVAGAVIELAKLVWSGVVSQYLVVTLACSLGVFYVLVNKQIVRFTIFIGSSCTRISSSTLLWLATLSLIVLLYAAVRLCHAVLRMFGTKLRVEDPSQARLLPP